MKPIRHLTHCLFCFGENSCSLRFTKHGKPYLVCQICMSRAFLNRFDGLRGPAIVPHLISAANASAKAGNVPWYDEQFREMTAYVTRTVKGEGLPDAPTAVPYSIEPGKEQVG